MIWTMTTLLACGFLMSLVGTWGIRKYALRSGLLDVPNQRSSHSVPTPRGGGLAFVMVFLVLVSLFGVHFFPAERALWWALLGGGALVAGVGWLDDRYGLSSRLRFLVHGIAAAWALYWLGGLPSLDVGFTQLPLSFVGHLLAWFGIVWLVNLYNFMDGIDGLAASEAVTVGGAAGLLLFLAGDLPMAMAAWGLAVMVGGFKVWNWPPAKIFMGDAGSGFLGFVFATLAIASEQREGLPLLAWLVLLAVFLVDATATLFYRMANGERWYEAHCSHAYQTAVQAGKTHLQVTTGVLFLNALLCSGVLIAYFYPALLVPVFLLSACGLGYVWYRIKITAAGGRASHLHS